MQKIVVVSTPRTGSTLLCEALAQHPHVFGCGEVFEYSEKGRAHYHKTACGDRRYYPGPEKFEAYVGYLEAIARLEGRSAVAFKLMDYQEPLAWRMLEECPAIPILIARRDNALESLASNKASRASGLWHARNAGEVERAAATLVEISRAELLEWHKRKTALDARVSALSNPRLVVEFSDLAAAFPGVMAGVFSFLDLCPWSVEPTQQRLHTRPLRERVRNYDTLAAECADSDLARYFTEAAPL